MKTYFAFLALPFFLMISFSCQKKTTNSHCEKILKIVKDQNTDWLVKEDFQAEKPVDSLILARFELPAGGEILLVDFSEKRGEPNIGVISVRPKVYKGKGPKFHLVSPLEIFLHLREGQESPHKKLVEHHHQMARLGIFDSIPRLQLSLPWLGGVHPDVPPQIGPVDLCEEGSFYDNWRLYSLWHGEENHWDFRELWTGWSVLTDFSEPRAAALCLFDEEINGIDAQARYRILNRESGGVWETVYESGWMGPGEGVGFSTYGPGSGQTRIIVTTHDDEHYYFWAGASWTESIDWIISGI